MVSVEIYTAVGLIAIGIFQYWIYKWRNPKCKGTLPPGSMGFPFIGETLSLLVPSNSIDMPPFIKKRIQKYGLVFKTHIAGTRAVISADPEINHIILRQDESVLESWYMDLFGKIFKQAQRKTEYPVIHKYLRNSTLTHFASRALQSRLLVKLEKFADETVLDWSTRDFIDAKRDAAKVTIEIGAKLLFGYDKEKSTTDLGDSFISFSQGLMSVPLNIPGTPYHTCLKECKRTKELIEEIIEQKLKSRGHGYKNEEEMDLVDCMISEMDSQKFVTKDFMVQNMFSLLFASYDSLSSILALSLKLLGENPAVLEELIAEHETILKRRENPNSPMTWEEYKSMRFTLNVIHETLRMGSVTPGLMRRARKDFKIKGYTIPADWTVVLVTTGLHFNKDVYEDPLSFNPRRWDKLSANTISDYFMPFGEGMKQCAGADYARVYLAMFLHVLVTKYRWTKVGGGQVGRYPTFRFKNGFRIKISPKTN